LIREKGWNPKRQSHYESIMALGNGRLGSRAALEECPQGAMPGTFLAGVFDTAGSIVDDLVNLPNPFELRVFADGQKLSVEAMKVIGHERVLDIRRGLLLRRTVFGKGLGGRIVFRTARFISRTDPGTCVLRAWITALDGDAEITVAGDTGYGVFNTEADWEGPKRHFAITNLQTGRRSSYMDIKTLETGLRIGYAWTTILGTRTTDNRSSIRTKLRKGSPLCVTKITNCLPAPAGKPGGLRKACVRGLARVLRRGIPGALADHERAWAALWNVSDISIAGALDVEKAVRFNVYHLLACGTDSGTPAGIGAKSLTGEGYRGHSFWDTEIYSLPFYTLNHPGMARQLVRYRLGRLDAARKNGRINGYRGALFPWESGLAGNESTPLFPDGKGGLVIFKSGMFEHHITADVALGLMNYLTATGDAGLPEARALELLAETARFWASRVILNRRTGYWEIRKVIGPDEYHVPVNNNAFTNFAARWNLETAADRLADFKERNPGPARSLFSRLHLSDQETAGWRRIAERISGTDPVRLGAVIEQFDGYFNLPHVPLPARAKSGMPVWPKGINEDNACKTQLIKQADVVTLMLLFPDRFTSEQKRESFAFYENRTLHISSLSACTYAMAGLEFGVPDRAMKYFLVSLYTDLKGFQETAKGIHTACCGGNWQTVVRGFGGAAVRDGVLCLDPRVPRQWGEMRYSLRWRGNLVRIQAKPGSVVIRNEGKSAVEARIFGHDVSLPPRLSVKRKDS
jgi:kojibiose phosphorylase